MSDQRVAVSIPATVFDVEHLLKAKKEIQFAMMMQRVGMDEVSPCQQIVAYLLTKVDLPESEDVDI